MKHMFRAFGGFVAAAGAAAMLSGCISDPTYGTSKTSSEHLVDGISSMFNVTPDTKNDEIAYQPHPGLVIPKNTDQLQPPQQSLAGSANNPNWVESPEQARKRLRAEADANANNPNYRSPLLLRQSRTSNASLDEQAKAYREARKIQQGAYLDKRRFLSDPPATYRKIDKADMNNLGEPERDKERRRKKEAESAKQSNSKWWDIFD